MRAEDSMWLVDTPGDGNAFVEMGSFIIDRCTAEDVTEIAKRNAEVRRFRQIPTFFLGKPCWKFDPNYEFRNHHAVHKEPVRNKKELQVLLDDYYNKPLKPNQSPWDSLIVEKYMEENSVLVFKFHHVFGDGLAALSQWTTCDDQIPQYYSLPKQGVFSQLFLLTLAVITLPYYLVKSALRPDYKFLLHGPPASSVRLTDFSDPISLTPIKLYCRQKGMKLNTYMFSALGESIRRYTEKYDKVPPLINLSLPYSFRQYPEDGSKLEMHNDICMLIWSQPLIADREKREEAIHHMLESMKKSPEVLAQSLLIKIGAGHLPYTLARALVLWIGNKVSLCFTNVPGPLNEIQALGKRLKQTIFHLNAIGRVNMMFMLFTYNNELTVCGTVDKSLADSPTELIELFVEEINRLGKD